MFTTKIDCHAVIKPDLPGAARRHIDLSRRLANRREAAPEMFVLDGHFLCGAVGTVENRQRTVEGRLKNLTMYIHQRRLAPTRQGHMFGKNHLQ